MQINYEVHTDPGHGWIKVPRREINKLGIAKQISAYSYQDKYGTHAYLEEDCDMPIFTNALKSRGIQFDIVEIHTDSDSPIRAMSSFRA